MELDDPVAIWDGSDVLGAVLNVGSNIFILPAVALSVWRRDYASALIYTHVFIASNLYHMCRAGLLCAYQFEKHQMTDYLFVYRAIVWTLTRLSVRSVREHIILFVFFTAVVYFAVEAKVSDLALPVLGIGLPLLVALLISCTMHRPVFRNDVWAGITFALMGVGGAFMFLADAPDYWWAHPMWHLFSMTASFTAELATFGVRPR